MQDGRADAAAVRRMACAPGAPLLKATATRVYDSEEGQETVGWLNIYILPAYAGVRDRIGREQRSVSSMIEELYGIRTAEVRQHITPTIIGDDLARRLNSTPGTAGLKVERAYVSQEGEVFEYTASHHAGKYAEISMRLRRQ